jgi:D-aspartate ligase
VARRYPPGMGPATYHVTDWNLEVRDVALRLFEHAGLRGLANAEFKRDVRDGRLKLIECNARFTAANGLVSAAGIELAPYVYRRVLGEDVELPSTYRTGLRLIHHAVDLRAFLVLRRRGELGLFEWLRSLAHRQTLGLFRVADPIPAIVRSELAQQVAMLRRRIR